MTPTPCYDIRVVFNVNIRNNADIEALVDALGLMPEVLGVERRQGGLAIATVRGPAAALVAEDGVQIEGPMAKVIQRQLKQCYATATQATLLRRKGFTVSVRREAGKLVLSANDRRKTRW